MTDGGRTGPGRSPNGNADPGAADPGAADPGAADRRHMDRALELARAGWGRVHPNPMVGAVVVRDGVVVGEGAHREFGGPHAEVEALAQAGEAARGATLYVTLEPCAHHVKTPPCTDAILAHGIARVVYAVADPTPEARGGSAMLAEAGVAVAAGVAEDRARVANAPFLVPATRHGPFVALKFGVSLDGRIAARDGERTRVTGHESERAVHRLRAGFDAILIGARTARIDDPSLTVRHGPPPRVPPVRVVADPGARLPPDGTLARTARETPVLALVTDAAPPERVAALRDTGVTVEPVPASEEGLAVGPALDRLWARGLRTVLCEGGGRLAASLLAADRVDRLYLSRPLYSSVRRACPPSRGPPGSGGGGWTCEQWVRTP